MVAGRAHEERAGEKLYYGGEVMMASSLAMSDLQEHLSEVVQRVQSGEEIVVEQDGKPSIRMTLAVSPEGELSPRVFGQNVLGVTYISPDCFDPMTEEELAEWGM